MPPVHRAVGNMVNTRGDIHPIMVTSTRQGSVPFAAFAGGGGGDTLDHYRYRGRCDVGKYYLGQKQPP